MTIKAIIYTRVSTSKQAKSTLSLSAQLTTCLDWIGREGMDLVGTYTAEGVSGGKAEDENKALSQAINHAQKTGAVIVVAKLCRLSRSVAFIAGMMERGVPFVSVELGKMVDPLVLHVWSAVNESFRRQVSQNTKKALAVKRAQLALEGKRLGASDESLSKSRVLAAEALKNKTDDWHAQVLTWIDFAKSQLTKSNPKRVSLQQIADFLNDDGRRTKRGKHFKAGTIHAILKRAQK